MSYRVFTLALLLAAFATAASAQSNPRLTSQFLPAGREMKQRLAGIATAIEEKSFAEAAGSLGELFLDRELEDYFVDDSGTSSLKSDAQKLLLSLPKAGRESYELQFGADAKMLLKQALEDSDEAKLAEVLTSYFHTKAGYEAGIVWARKQLDAGRPLAAAVMLDRVLAASPNPKEYEPELSLLTAISWRLAGGEERAEEVLLALKRRQTAQIDAAGRKVSLFTDDAQAIAWLDDLIGVQAAVAPHEVTQWLMHRGSPARNATTLGSFPVSSVRWHKPLGRDENDDVLLAKQTKRFQTEGVGAIPTLSPLVVNNTVLMRTPERLLAIDLATGKSLWRYPWVAKPQNSTLNSSRGPSAAQQHEREVMQRVWEDRPYGQLTSDGDAVYLIDDLGYAGMGYTTSARILPGGFRQPNPDQPKSHNKLVAISLANAHQPKWIAGGESGEAEPKLAGAFFLGPPLAVDGRLYAMIELGGELRLVVLDPKDGKLIWSQQLAHIEQVAMQIVHDSTRRLAGATPSLASGILVCPTSASTVVAVDLAQRRLLWGYKYEQAGAIAKNVWIGYVQPSRPIGTYWLDSTPTIVDGKVILTLSDSDFLVCLDLVTGKEVWKPIKRADTLADMLYVAGVADGKIALVGRNRVTAINLADGKPSWNAAIELATGELPSGRGFLSGNHYYLPTSQAQLLKIDLREGKIVERAATERALGNLVAYRDQLISQNTDGVSAFYQSEALRTILVEKLQANPKDPAALAQRAQLELHDGKPAEALATLRAAHALDKGNDDTRALLVQTLLQNLKTDVASPKDLAAEIEPLLDQPQQRREYLRLKGHGQERAKDLVGAFATYCDLAAYEIDVRPDSSTAAGLENFEPQLRVRLDRWVQTRLLELHRTAAAADQAKMDAALAARFAKLPAAPTPDQRARIVEYFGWHDLADSARLELAAQKLESGEPLAAELLLMKFAETNEGEAAGKATALLTQIYEKAGRMEYAARHYHRLQSHWPQAIVHNGKTGQQLLDGAMKLPAMAARIAPRAWPGGEVKVSEGGDHIAGNLGFATFQRTHPMTIAEARGALDDGSALILDTPRRQLLLRDRLGNDWTQVALARPDRPTTTTQPAITHAHLVGHLAVVAVGQDLFAYDFLKRSQDPLEPQLWRQDLLPTPADGRGTLQQVRSQTAVYPWALPRNFAATTPDATLGAVAAISDRAVCFTRSREIVCVDPISGDTLWERTLDKPGYELFGDDELLFAVPPLADEALVLSTRDGRELGKRKVDRMANRWTTLGRRVLAMRQDAREFEGRLYDAWTGELLWEGKFDFGSRGTLIGRDEMAMMQPDGKFVLLSLATGKVKLETQLAPEPKLMNVHVLRSSTQYFVQMETIIDGRDSIPEMTVQPMPGGDTSKFVTGRLYALDRATLKPSWQSPAFVSQFGFPLDQPAELPLLFMIRQLTPLAAAAGREPRTSVLVLDRRDGRPLLERDNIRIQQANAFEASGDPASGTVTLSLLPSRGAQAGKTFTFKLTDDPTPPAPPAQTGAMSSLPSPFSGTVVPPPTERPVPGREPGRPAIPPLPPGFPPGLPR